ncbi:MAG: hypothetical protein ABI574_00885 [Burkholderiales bacterium]
MNDTDYEQAWGDGEEAAPDTPLKDAAKAAHKGALASEADTFAEAFNAADPAVIGDGEPAAEDEWSAA